MGTDLTGPPPGDPDPGAPEQNHPPTRTRPWLVPLATGLAGLAVGVALTAGVGAAQDAAEQRAAEEAAAAEQAAEAARFAVLTDAVNECDLVGVTGLDVGDEGATVTFDMKGEDELTGIGYTDVACLLGELGTPSNVLSHIDQTTSMDGRQTESWDNITVSWSYHPDRGLDGVLTVELP